MSNEEALKRLKTMIDSPSINWAINKGFAEYDKEHDEEYPTFNGMRLLCQTAIKALETVDKIPELIEKLEEKSMLMANSKKFYDNPKNGEYVDEVVLLDSAIDLVKQILEVE